MVEVPDVGAIVKQIKARIGHIEEQLKQHRQLSDELERLRDALGRLESGVSTRVRGRRTPAKATPQQTPRASKTATASTTPPSNKTAAAKEKAATTRRPPAARAPRRAAPAAPRGQTRPKILQALKDGPKTAGEIAEATGIKRETASTTLTKLAKAGEVVKAERGYKLPG